MATETSERTYTVDCERVEVLAEKFAEIIAGERCVEVVHAFAFALLKMDTMDMRKGFKA